MGLLLSLDELKASELVKKDSPPRKADDVSHNASFNNVDFLFQFSVLNMYVLNVIIIDYNNADFPFGKLP